MLSHEVDKIFDTLRAAAAKGAHELAFYAGAVAALERPAMDRDEEVLRMGERWQLAATGPDYYKAADRLGLFSYLAGRPSDAVEAEERSLEYLRADEDLDKKDRKEREKQIKLSLVHYLAELGNDRREARGQRARELITDLKENYKVSPADEDSIGFAEIVFGRDADAIEAGRRLRMNAKAKVEGDEVAVRIMEALDWQCTRIASERIADIDRSP